MDEHSMLAEIRTLLIILNEKTATIAEAQQNLLASLESQGDSLRLLSEAVQQGLVRQMRADAAELALQRLRWVLDSEERIDVDFLGFLYAVLMSIEHDGLTVRDAPGVKNKQDWQDLLERATERAIEEAGTEGLSDWHEYDGWLPPGGEYGPTLGPGLGLTPDQLRQRWREKRAGEEQLRQRRQQIRERLRRRDSEEGSQGS